MLTRMVRDGQGLETGVVGIGRRGREGGRGGLGLGALADVGAVDGASESGRAGFDRPGISAE